MRVRVLLPAAVAVAIVAGGSAGQASVAASRNTQYEDGVRQLQSTWQQDVADGGPAAAVEPLRTELAAARTPGWWSSDWWSNSPQQVLSRLQSRTQEVWDSALARSRAPVLADARDLVKTAGSMAPAPFSAGVATWPQEIAAAPDPNALKQLATRY